MSRVKCEVCVHEKDGFCGIKKSKIKLNKNRICNKYMYDESKVKARQEVPSIKFGYKEKEAYKKRMKEELKVLKKMMQNQPQSDDSGFVTSIPNNFENQKHPTTGDLSRFTTTVNDK